MYRNVSIRHNNDESRSNPRRGGVGRAAGKENILNLEILTIIRHKIYLVIGLDGVLVEKRRESFPYLTIFRMLLIIKT